MPTPSSQNIRPVWLASYPRSGNTFLRIILEKIFHLPTFSLYRIEGQKFRDPSAEALEDAPFLPANWRDNVADTKEAKLTLIKTHDLPEDQRPAIYVVRDGRATIDSYFHYHQKFAFEQPSLTEVIAGACQFGSWSEHYTGWKPHSRPDTLFLKYEELVASPEAAIPKLAEFLDQKPVGGRLPTFEELNQKFPAFFRRGRNEDFLARWTQGQLGLFNALHGEAMQALGYPASNSGEVLSPVGLELAASAARLHKLYLRELHNQALSIETREKLSRQLAQLTAEIQAKDELLQPLAQSHWVKIGTALRLVPRLNGIKTP